MALQPIFNVAREEGSRPGTYFYHIEDGYQYHLSDQRPGTMYFKCVKYERGCRGRATLDDDEGFLHTNEHNHERDLHYPEEMAVRRRILDRCRALDYASFSAIIQQECHGAHQEVRIRIFVGRMRTSMRNARMLNYPLVPHDLRALTLTLMNNQYRVMTMTEDGLDNIYAGSVTDPDGAHHVLFMSERMMEVARNMNTIHGDGTFKIRPAGLNISQVFCIVASWRFHNLSLGFAFMECRSQNAYIAVLELLQHHLGPNIQLTKVITDFEAAMQNAFMIVFHVRVQGCLWHACRLFLNDAAEFGLIVLMRQIPEVRRVVRMTMAIPLLPRHYMRAGLLVVVEEAREEGNYIFQVVQPYLQHLWTNWLRSDRKCARLTVFGSALRTNNTNESQNKTWVDAAGRHPGVYPFLATAVKLEQQSYDMVVALDQGRRVGRGRKLTSIVNDDRIRQLSIDLVHQPGPLNQAILRFLRAASAVMNGLIDEAMR